MWFLWASALQGNVCLSACPPDGSSSPIPALFFGQLFDLAQRGPLAPDDRCFQGVRIFARRFRGHSKMHRSQPSPCVHQLRGVTMNSANPNRCTLGTRITDFLPYGVRFLDSVSIGYTLSDSARSTVGNIRNCTLTNWIRPLLSPFIC